MILRIFYKDSKLVRPKSLVNLQHGCIPVYDMNIQLAQSDSSTLTEASSVNKLGCLWSCPTESNFVYRHFFEGAGCLILKNAYRSDVMDRFNQWCETCFEEAKRTDGNIRHPKQAGKLLLNDVINRMADGWGHNTSDNPDIQLETNRLLLDLLSHPALCETADVLLGFAKFGACTGHWIEGKGDRQLAHVDYPMHVGSGIEKKYIDEWELPIFLRITILQVTELVIHISKFRPLLASLDFSTKSFHHTRTAERGVAKVFSANTACC